jgi:hypothetical protein
MSEILKGGIGGLGQAQKVIEEVQKKSAGKSFDDVMSKVAGQKNGEPTNIQLPNNVQSSFVQQTIAAKPTQGVNKIEADRLKVAQGIQKTDPTISSPLKNLVGSIANDQGAMTKLMNVAMSGQQFSPAQLLTLQSATYKVTFELDAMSKLAETASGAVKTTMQTQV